MSDKKPKVITTPPVGLSDEYHSAIGLITVNGALMDQLIDTAIWVTLQMPPDRGVIVTSLILNTSRKITFLRDLLDPMFSGHKVRKDFHDVFSKLKSAQKNRSKIVHAKWIYSREDQSIHIVVPESADSPQVAEAMPLKKLQRYGDEIAQAHDALEKFFLNVEITHHSSGTHIWPPRYQEQNLHQRK